MNRRAYLLGAAMVLLCNLVAVALRSYAEAAFIAEHGAPALPWLLVANAVGFAAATLGYDAITRRTHARGVDPVLVGALAVAAAVAPSLLAAHVQPIVLVVALTALSQVSGLALWNRVAASVAGRDARRMLPRAGAAVTAGGAIAGLSAGVVIPRLGASALPYAAAAVSLVILGIALAQQRALDTGGAPGATAPAGAPPPTALGELTRRLLRWLVVVSLLEAAVATIADLQFAAAIKAHYPDAVAVAVALFYGGTNLVLLLLQVAAVPRILVTRSMRFTASVQPLLVAAGYALVAAAPAFAVIAGTRTADQVLRAAAARPAQELQLSALPPGPRARWKVLLRGVAWPAGAAVAALVLLAVGPRAVANPAWLAGAAIVIALACLLAARTSARTFQTALAAPLGIRAARVTDDARRIEVGALERWTEAAGDADPRTAAIARAALDRARVDPSDLADHLRHDSAAVRVAMFDQLARAPTPSLRNELRAAIGIEDDDRALALAIKALALAGDDGGIARGLQRAGLAREVDAAVATATLALRGGDVLAALPELCGRDAAWAAAIVRARRATIDEDALAAVLRTAAADDGEAGGGDATARATRSAGALAVIARVGPDAALPALDAALALGGPHAAAAITDLDADGAAYLAARAAHLSTRARIALARALAGAPAAGELVGALLADADPEVAYAALRTALATARAGAALTSARIDAAHAAALAALVAYLDARDGAAAWPACARGELDIATRRAVARVLWAGAVEAAVGGGDPAPLAATARHLTRGSEAERKRALDVMQEVHAGRGEILAVIERWLRAPAPTGAADPAALAAVDAWLGALVAGAHAAVEPALLALRRPALFASVAGPALAELAARAQALSLAAGAELFAAGAPGETMFVVVTGALVAQRPPAPARTITAGGVVGELAVLTHAPRAARVVGGPDGAELLVLDRAAFLATARRAPELVLGLSATLAGWIAPGRADVLP